MKLFVPELGTELTLAKDWTFTVWPERRNETLVKLVSPKNKGSFLHTWEKGTKLTVDRIYIRKGAEGFSSVTFKTIVNKKTIRFWASLGEVNKIEISDSKLEPKTEKWPDGKFTWVRCQTRNWSDTLKKYEYIGEPFNLLEWQGSFIRFRENGLKFKSRNWFFVDDARVNWRSGGPSRSTIFERERTSLESLKAVCRKGGVSEELINEFEKRYLENLNES